MLARCAVLALSCAAACPGLRAQSEAPGSAAAMVARVSLLDGDVQVSTAGYHAETVSAALNMPLHAGQTLKTEANADAEVEFPDGSVLRAVAGSSATLIRLQPQTEIGLDDGLYYLELRAGTDPPFVVYAGDVLVEPKENASVRIRVKEGQPEIAVLRGTVSVTRANSYTVDLQHGESLRTDPKDGRRYLLADTVGPETGDVWNERRAQQLADAAANRTVAREDYAGDQGYGWSDLDNDGGWYPLPGEGLVWQPYGVDASFDPYGAGSWVYDHSGAGYVWASGYSWGWLPYHCGSWSFFGGFGWGWQPAAGCRSFGVGWPAGDFPVKHAPHGWHGPRPPVPGGIVIRHPTLPVAPPEGTVRRINVGLRRGQPIERDGVLLRSLGAVAPPATPHGGSAVGSALRRDYPVQNGTHLPIFGVEGQGAPALPGRAPEWRTLHASASRGEPEERAVPAAAEAMQGGRVQAGETVAESAVGAALVAPAPTAPEPTAPVGGAANPTYMTGWHTRITPLPPARPAVGSGIVVAVPRGLHPVPVPASPVPVLPPIHRGLIMVLPTRTLAPAPATPRMLAPPPSPAPHVNALPPMRVSPPAAGTRH